MEEPQGQAKAQHDRRLGVYFHVPFCGQACDFCNFYQEAPSRQALREYLDVMAAELALLPPARRGCCWRTT